jgi:hypothetical protein
VASHAVRAKHRERDSYYEHQSSHDSTTRHGTPSKGLQEQRPNTPRPAFQDRRAPSGRSMGCEPARGGREFAVDATGMKSNMRTRFRKIASPVPLPRFGSTEPFVAP